MEKIKVKHLKSGQYLGVDIEMANSLYTRLMGLMFANSFGNRDGIWFQPSNSIHSFFVKIPFDAIFINKQNEIVKIYKNFKPWRLTPIIWGASRVLELPEGRLPENIQKGDELEVTYV